MNSHAGGGEGSLLSFDFSCFMFRYKAAILKNCSYKNKYDSFLLHIQGHSSAFTCKNSFEYVKSGL